MSLSGNMQKIIMGVALMIVLILTSVRENRAATKVAVKNIRAGEGST